MVKVEGTDDIFDLVPAPGEISNEGTFINKATLLKDATAEMFGLGADAVPDDVLSVLSSTVLHWWGKRVPDASSYKETKTLYASTLNISQKSSTTIWNVADEVSFDPWSGAVSLKNPTSTSINYSQSEATAREFFETLKGHYVTSPNVSSTHVFYFPADIPSSALKFTSGNLVLSVNYAYLVGSFYEAVPPSEWTMLSSANRNAYPDSGIVDGYEYAYFGIPWKNARLPVNVATGTYVGVGTSGESNPNSLTFDFEPKLIVLFNNNGSLAKIGSTGDAAIGNAEGLTHEYVEGALFYSYYYSNAARNMYAKKSDDGRTIFWYHTGTAADQYNYANVFYRYIAIG